MTLTPKAADGLDLIFVRDFVLPVEIGLYEHEQGRTQSVRFSVTVGVARPAAVPHRIGDVLSYDVITDLIRSIVARGHIILTETLAEDIAAGVLAHERALTVTVRIEKLDTGSGIVGTEIARERRR